MIILKEAATLKQHAEQLKKRRMSLGFVPTMGALHQGHISLIEKSRNSCDVTVCSIFINPAQFNNAADFEKYPVTIASDVSNLLNAGADILFLPSVHEMYPEGFTEDTHYDLGYIENILEGKYRPGHFQGVCKVVHKLLAVINPDVLFLGQKDYQQCLVVKRLLELLDLPVKLQTEATFRSEEGLAMSSRNLRLNEKQKEQATGIYKVLLYMKANYKRSPLPDLEKYATDYLLNNGFQQVDYVSIADAGTLLPMHTASAAGRPIALIAASIGGIRLIDNLLLST